MEERERGTLGIAEEEQSPGAVGIRHHAGKAEAAARVLERLFAGLTGATGEDVAVNEARIVRIYCSLQMLRSELPVSHSCLLEGTSSGCFISSDA